MSEAIWRSRLVWLFCAWLLCACGAPSEGAPDVFCGGFAGIACPGGGICEDAPGDVCNPEHGGADCGGVCRCLQTALCIRGYEFDSSAAVCACVPRAAENPCALVDCQPGARCEVRGEEGICVSNNSL